MNCPKCNNEMKIEIMGDSSDFSFDFEELAYCERCGYETDDIPLEHYFVSEAVK